MTYNQRKPMLSVEWLNILSFQTQMTNIGYINFEIFASYSVIQLIVCVITNLLNVDIFISIGSTSKVFFSS